MEGGECMGAASVLGHSTHACVPNDCIHSVHIVYWLISKCFKSKRACSTWPLTPAAKLNQLDHK